MTETELERIRAEYEARDAAATSPYRWDNPGYVTYMQIVERALLKAFRDAGVQLEGARVLDVGAGSGYFLHRLTEYGAAEGHGVDLMKDRVAAGQKRYPTLQLEVGSATELPYRGRCVRPGDAVHLPLLDPRRRSAARSRARDAARRRRRLGSLLRHARASPTRFAAQGRPTRRPFRSTKPSCGGSSATRPSCGERRWPSSSPS